MQFGQAPQDRRLVVALALALIAVQGVMDLGLAATT